MKRKILLLLLSVLMVFAMVACDEPAPSVPRVDDDDAETSTSSSSSSSSSSNKDDEEGPSTPVVEQNWLNVSTYNIVHCADQSAASVSINPDNIANFIKEYDIDIIGLNEVDVNCARSAGFVRSEYYTKYGSNQPKYIAAKLTEMTGEQYYWAFAPGLDGYHTPARASQGNGQYGNAIVSKYPIVSFRGVQMAVHEIDPEDPTTQIASPSFERRVLLIAEIAVDEQIITVISTHFGLQASERELAIQMLKGELKTIKTPVIFMGDLNCGYQSDIIQELNMMFKPTSTAAKPGTFVSSDSRIDYIFTSDDIATKDLQVPHNVLYSDHYPVLVKMLLKKPVTA